MNENVILVMNLASLVIAGLAVSALYHTITTIRAMDKIMTRYLANCKSNK